MKVRVTNIQRFSLQDGPGIRTTVFLKGCSLKCPWCSNPENIKYGIEEYYLDDNNGKHSFGYDIDLDELESEIKKDIIYYRKNNGGVTFSGGEALLQFDKLEPLLKKLNSDKINICIESSLFVPKKQLDIAIKYVDEFFIDIKLLNGKLCKKILHGDLNTYYKNIDYLFSKIKKEKIHFRIPITSEYSFDKDNLIQLDKFLSKYKPNNVEIFKVHNLGQKKYEVLNLPIKKFDNITNENMNQIKKIINNNNIPVVECKI